MAVDKDILKLKKEIKELKKDLQSIKKEFQIVSVSNQEMKAFFENIYEITTIK